VPKTEKLLAACRNNAKGIRFDDLVRLAKVAGFTHDRTSGSHLIFVHPRRDVPMQNLQRTKDGMAKPYRVKQVLDVIDAHDLEVD
jgi:predicted RNA binding protein YcfA (HicA-like mRNA interferase family)